MKVNRTLVTLAAIASALAAPAFAFDTAPGDYVQAPDGTNLLVLYGQATTRESAALADGRALPGARLDSQTTTLRYVRYIDVGPIKINPQVFLSWGSIDHVQSRGHAVRGSEGAADPVVACLFGLVNRPQSGTWAGVALGAYVPVGKYEPGAPVNIGNNRWAKVVQAGLSQRLWEGVAFDGTIDLTTFDDNHEAGTGRQTLSQAPSTQVQPWLTWTPVDGTALSVGMSRTFGGKFRLDGVDTGMRTETGQVRLQVAQSLGNGLKATFTASRDTDVDGGYREKGRATLRLSALF